MKPWRAVLGLLLAAALLPAAAGAAGGEAAPVQSHVHTGGIAEEMMAAFLPVLDQPRPARPLGPDCRAVVLASRRAPERRVFLDLNRDGRPDLVDIRPSVRDGRAVYEHRIHLQRPNGEYSPSPDQVVETTGASWATGLFADVDRDGYPDRVEVRTTAYGLFNQRRLSRVAVTFFDRGAGAYAAQPGLDIKAKGVMPRDLTLRDVDGDGHPDLIFLDWVENAVTPSQAVSQFLTNSLILTLAVHLYDASTRSYPAEASFKEKFPFGLHELPRFTWQCASSAGELRLAVGIGAAETLYRYDHAAHRLVRAP